MTAHPSSMRTSARWAKLDAANETLPVGRIVPLVVPDGEPPSVWSPGLASMCHLPGPAPSRASTPVLSSEGRFALFELSELDHSDDSVPYVERVRSSGVFRTHFDDHRTERLNFAPWQHFLGKLAYAASPDQARVAVAQIWYDSPPGVRPTLPDQRVTLWIAGFSDAPAERLLAWTGEVFEMSDASAVQWSPDGSHIALSLVVSSASPTDVTACVVIVDVRSGVERDRIGGATICGTSSWSPDGGSLLIADSSWVPRVYDLETKQAEAIPAFPQRIADSSARSALRPLGFVSDDSLLVFQVRSTIATLSSFDMVSGDRRPIVRWSVEVRHHHYPVVARMPNGFWA